MCQHKLIVCCLPCRFLVIVCDAKVLLHDLSSKKSFEIGRQLLDGKTPTCIAFLFKVRSSTNGNGITLQN